MTGKRSAKIAETLATKLLQDCTTHIARRWVVSWYAPQRRLHAVGSPRREITATSCLISSELQQTALHQEISQF